VVTPARPSCRAWEAVHLLGVGPETTQEFPSNLFDVLSAG
jgi:hypothetical protein